MGYRVMLFAAVCLLFAGLSLANPEVAPVCHAPESAPAPTAEPDRAAEPLAELFVEPRELSCTCMEARRNCDELCWLNGCVVGSFHCQFSDPCNYTCECDC